ncbi:hypothetical protein CLV78_101387 [Aliiruegeria haliotis]|uniref:Uncharacterized protein n=1 Tax=Aliiruegeria haliotis TaxID=1280846 RepID=A0A2T0RYS7_9RHOB|nr:DUF6477 family protein [Aliiruegeria haliotis]PRY26292.1 hypothetical protein CLV78_101387 [Aliiruegeria haliotis]
MTDFIQALGALRRPRLLIRAARHGIGEYNHSRDFKRVMRSDSTPAPERAVRKLMDAEAELDRRRREGDASYSPSRHVEIMIALMAEARSLLRGPMAA